MLSRRRINYIGGVVFMLSMLTACGGGGGISFSIDGNNWPWPWQTNASYFAQKTFLRNISVADLMNLQLDGVNGVINIKGQPGADSVSVSAEAQVGSDSYNDAREYLNQLEVSMTDGNGKISIQTLQPDNTLGRQFLVDYTLTIPSQLSVNVSLVNGHVTVTDIEKPVFVVLENGNVSLTGITGGATVNIENGSINGTMSLPAAGEVEISTVNGNIDLRIPTNTSAELFIFADNGIINWDNLELLDPLYTNQSLQGLLGDGNGQIDLETVNGDIDLAGTNI